MQRPPGGPPSWPGHAGMPGAPGSHPGYGAPHVPHPAPSGPGGHYGGHTPSGPTPSHPGHVFVDTPSHSYPGPLPVLQQVGRYELLVELASGGMGSVYVGRQRGAAGFERLVAIKRMHPHLTTDQELTLAFHQEARIASQIHHPNVVNVVDVYEEGGEHLLVMEYIEGGSVSDLLGAAKKRGARLPRSVALRIAIDALAGLHAAHELTTLEGRPMMVVHRDVSPQNILVGADGTVRLTDFGIARAVERMVHTATGHLKGKLRYMPPEQALGQPIDRRADVFALGVVLWEMLAGERLYQGDNELDLLRAAAECRVRPLRQVDPAAPPALEAILARALAAHPDHRFATAADFARALEHYAWESREAGAAADVAATLSGLVGERVRERRQVLSEILGGRRPVAIRATGTHPVVNLQHTPTAQPAMMTGAGPAPRGAGVTVMAVALVAVIGVVGGVAAFVMLRPQGGSAPAASAAPGPAPTGEATAAVTATAAASAAVATRVRVELHTNVAVSEVRGPGVGDIAFREGGATFTLPKGDAPVDVEVKLAGEAEYDVTSVTPSSDTAVRLEVKGAGAPAAQTGPRTGPRVTVPTPAPAGTLRKNPYQ